jgi:hypothetical protein
MLLLPAGITGLDALRSLLHTSSAAASAGLSEQHTPVSRGVPSSPLQQQFSSSSSKAHRFSPLRSSSTAWLTGSVRHYSAAVPATAMPTEGDEALAAPGQLSAKEYRQKYSMWVLPADAPAPYQTFDQAPLPPQLLKAVSTPGWFSRRSRMHQDACASVVAAPSLSSSVFHLLLMWASATAA